MSTSRILTLSTDFGLSDSYVAQMKGVVLSLCPRATLVDITHQLPQYDVDAAARVLREALPLFPNGSVHVAVVDPGVGSARHRIIVKAELGQVAGEHYFVGPDNGVFSLVAPKETRRGVWAIENLDLLPAHLASATFEGRAVFAPVAALLATGEHWPQEFGPCLEQADDPFSRIVELREPQAAHTSGGIQGEIVWFDSFGNAATNISRLALGDSIVRVLLNGVELQLYSHFAQMPADTLCAVWNSQGELELATRENSARDLFKLQLGMRLDVYRC